MSDNGVENKRKQLQRLEEEVALVQRKIDLLHLIDHTEQEIAEATKDIVIPPKSIEDQFPVGTPLKFTNPNEIHHLRGQQGKVMGHSPKFVRVKRGKEKHLRLPSNLTKQLDDE